jgi:iron complex outermembrane receptor protein
MKRLMVATGLSLCGIAVLMTTPARAESAGAKAGEVLTELSEVVVTAQRREERAVDVPITITSISAEQLKDANVQQLTDIATVTPALRFDRENTWVQPTIRGVGTALALSGGGANVGIYIDGFYSPNPLSAEFDLLNVSGIQVLKGPQGTLFGRNTTGGAILVATANPSTRDAAIVQASYGRFNTQRYQGYATMGLTDSVAVDVEGLLSTGDGHVRDLVSGNGKIGKYKNSAVRLGLSWNPSEQTSFLLRYSHLKNDDPTYLLINAYVLNGVPQTVGSFFPGAPIATDPDQVALNAPVFMTNDTDVVQLTGSFDLGFGSLKSYTQYRRERHREGADLDASGAPAFNIMIPVDDKTVSQEFLLTSNPGGKLQWTTGLFYFSNIDHWHDIAGSQLGAPFAVFADSNTNTTSLAAFADGTYEVAPKFFITAGLRYTRDKIKDAFFYDFPPPTFAYTRETLPDLSSSKATPRVVLRYKPTDESSVYASFAKGYKAPIYNVGGASRVPVDAESIDAIEAGYKYASHALSVDLSVFHYSYKNLQVATYTGTASIVNNAASASVKGAEAAVRYQIMPALELSAGAAYTNARYDRYDQAPSVGPLAFGLPGTITNAAGFEMQRAPKLTGNLGLQYTVAVGSGKIGLSGNLYHSSSFFFDAANQATQGGYDLLNLRAEWTNAADRLSIALTGDNVTNKRYRLAGNVTQQLAVRSTWNLPAMYMATVRLKL